MGQKLVTVDARKGNVNENIRSGVIKKTPCVCLLGASFGTYNMGINALTAGTIKAFITQFAEGDLFLLDYGKKAITYNWWVDGRIVDIQLENIRFSKKFYLKNNIAFLILMAGILRCIPFRRIQKKLIFSNYWLRRMESADVVVSMAGGDSFSDIYGVSRLLYVSLPQILVLLLRKNLILLPQTIGPFKSFFAKVIAKSILRRARLIYSRDHQGVKEARQLIGLSGSNEKVKFCYDVGFVLDPVKPKEMDFIPKKGEGLERPLVGVNISGLLYMGGYSGKNMFGLKFDYKDFIPELVDLMIRKNDSTVILIPHVFGSDGESDSVICKEVYSLLKERYNGRLLVADGNYDQGEIKYVIGLCDFFIGSRMHACIAALSQTIPTVSIAYSGKFIGVMESIGVQDLVVDPRKYEKGEILIKIESAFEQRAQFKAKLEKTMPRVKETILNLFSEIDPLLK